MAFPEPPDPGCGLQVAFVLVLAPILATIVYLSARHRRSHHAH